MGMVRSVSVILDTGATYPRPSDNGRFVNLEENTFPRNLKVTAKGLEISEFGIVEYYIISESEHMIALRDQAYYIPGLPKDLRIISPQVICT